MTKKDKIKLAFSDDLEVQSQLNKGEEGEKGERGEQGKQGIQGIQGKTGEQGKPGKPGKDGEDGKDGKQGEKGEKGDKGQDLKSDKIVKDVLEELQKTQILEPKNIKGLPLNMSDMRWHGGGLSNITGLVMAGSNITITGIGTTGDPFIVNSTAVAGTVWGTITGTLSNQTDLQTALNLKANLSGATFTGAISATNLSGTNTGDQTTITGNAGSATILQNARTINGVSFNGSANITVTADASTLTGTVLKSTVVTSSLTSVGTLSGLDVRNGAIFTGFGNTFNALEASTLAFQINAQNGQPMFTQIVTNAAANARVWDTLAGSVSLSYRAVSDAYAAATAYMVAERNAGASTIKYVYFPNGIIGIGTTAPDASYKMTISGNTGTVGPAILFVDTAASPTNWLMGPDGNHNFIFRDQTAAANRIIVQTSTGNVGIGTIPASSLDVLGVIRTTSIGGGSPATGAGIEIFYNAGVGNLLSYDRSGGTYKPFAFDGSSTTFNVSGSPRLTLAAGSTFVGNVRFSSYGVGTITSDASGNLTSVSDERMKDIQGFYNIGLKEILNVDPILYKWNEKSGMETEHTYAGFSAQNVEKALGEYGIGENKDGIKSLQDRALMAAMVNAIKELNEQIIKLKATLNDML